MTPAQTDKNQSGIQWELIQWSQWARQNGINLRAKSPMLTLIRHLSGTVLSAALIDDERAERIESAIRALATRDAEKADIVKDYYLKSMSDSQIGRKLRITRDRARNYRLAAENWIDGAINH